MSAYRTRHQATNVIGARSCLQGKVLPKSWPAVRRTPVVAKGRRSIRSSVPKTAFVEGCEVECRQVDGAAAQRRSIHRAGDRRCPSSRRCEARRCKYQVGEDLSDRRICGGWSWTNRSATNGALRLTARLPGAGRGRCNHRRGAGRDVADIALAYGLGRLRASGGVSTSQLHGMPRRAGVGDAPLCWMADRVAVAGQFISSGSSVAAEGAVVGCEHQRGRRAESSRRGVR